MLMITRCIFQFPVNKLTDLLRIELSAAGFTEVLTFALVSLLHYIFILPLWTLNAIQLSYYETTNTRRDYACEVKCPGTVDECLTHNPVVASSNPTKCLAPLYPWARYLIRYAQMILTFCRIFDIMLIVTSVLNSSRPAREHAQVYQLSIETLPLQAII